MRQFVIAVLAVMPLAASSAEAGQPGQPLDCSDWVFLEPGLSCGYWAHYPCYSNLVGCGGGGDNSLDNQGRLLGSRFVVIGTCPSNLQIKRLELTAYDGTSTTVLGYIDERCNDVGTDNVQYVLPGHYFREEHGEFVYGRLSSICTAPYPQTCSYYPETPWRPVFRGFATEFEVLQTYTPSDSVGFRVPYMPEGFRAADHFDTYWGSITHPIDFTQAQPLECHYPASPPSVGDYFEVADTLPTPPPGTGYYYVTAVTYRDERRYGRQARGGVLSGRDPARLPPCEE